MDIGNNEYNQLMKEYGLLDLEKDGIGAYYHKVDQSECFDWTSIFIVELPVSEYGHPEVIEAKKNEVINLQDYATFK